MISGRPQFHCSDGQPATFQCDYRSGARLCSKQLLPDGTCRDIAEKHLASRFTPTTGPWWPVGISDEEPEMTSSLFANAGEISKQKRKKLDEATGQWLAATGIAAAFAASLAILAYPVGGALAAQTVQVEVANPRTNPAPTSSVDDPGRIAYQATVQCVPGQSLDCDFTFSAVPQGRRLIVQHVSGSAGFVSAPTATAVLLLGGANAALSAFNVPGGEANVLFDQAVLQYFDPGSVPVLTVEGRVAFNPNAAQIATLTGYLLDCNAAPCAPIAP
jgi:hypothetical protein